MAKSPPPSDSRRTPDRRGFPNRRGGLDRRVEDVGPGGMPERRTGDDRRSGSDRRKWVDRRGRSKS